MKVGIIFATILLLATSVSCRKDKQSPRYAAMAVIKNAGCTNLVLAHYIYNAALSGASASFVLELIGDVGTFTTTQVAKW